MNSDEGVLQSQRLITEPLLLQKIISIFNLYKFKQETFIKKYMNKFLNFILQISHINIKILLSMPKNINPIRMLGNWAPLKIRFSSYQGDQIIAITSANSIGTYNLDLKKQEYNAAVMQGNNQKIQGEYYVNQTGQYLYTVSEGCLVGWKIQQNKPNGMTICGESKFGVEQGNNVKIARHKQVIAITDWQKLGFWNATSGQYISTNKLQSEHKRVIFLEFSKDGKVLFLCDQAGKLYIFNNNSPYFSLFKIRDLEESVNNSNYNGQIANMTFVSMDTIEKSTQRDRIRYFISLVHSDQKQAIHVHEFNDNMKVIMKTQSWDHHSDSLQTLQFISQRQFLYQNPIQLELYQLDYDLRTIKSKQSEPMGKVPIAMAYEQKKRTVALGLNNGELHIYKIGQQQSGINLGLPIGFSIITIILLIIGALLLRRYIKNRGIPIQQFRIQSKAQLNSQYDMVDNKSMELSSVKNTNEDDS